MVLYHDTDACFAQTHSEANEPKHIHDYCRENESFGSPPLASEANVRFQNANFPSQVLNSLSNEISRTYLSGSPDQEVMRCKNYLKFPEGHNSPVLNTDDQNCQRHIQSTTSIRNDVDSKNLKENVPPPVMGEKIQQHTDYYQEDSINNQQQQVHQDKVHERKLLSGQEDDEMYPFLKELSEIQPSASLPNQLPKDNQINSLSQPNDPNINVSTRCDFPLDFSNPISTESNACSVTNSSINSETLISPRPSSITTEGTSVSGLTSRRFSEGANSSRSCNSRDLNTSISDLASPVPSCTEGNFNVINASYQNASFGPESHNPNDGGIHQDFFPNEPNLQALMMLAGPSKLPIKKRVGRPLGSKNGVRKKKISDTKEQTTSYHSSLSQDVQNFAYVQQQCPQIPVRYQLAPYSQHTAGYPQQGVVHPQQAVGYQQSPLGYPQQTPKYLQRSLGYPQQAPGFMPMPQEPLGQPRRVPGHILQTGYPAQHSISSQKSVHSQPPPPYPEQLLYNQQSPAYGHQHSGYTQFQQMYKQTHLFRLASGQQLSGLQFPRSTEQFPEYTQCTQNFSKNKQRHSPYSHLPSDYREELSRYAQPIIKYAQQTQFLPHQSRYNNHPLEYNQHFSKQIQQFKEQYPINQQIPAQNEISIQNQQYATQVRQFPKQIHQFPNQNLQFSGQTQQFQEQAPQLSGHFFNKAQFFPPASLPKNLTNSLERISSPLEHFSNSSQYLPSPSANFPHRMDQPPEYSNNFSFKSFPIVKNQKLTRSWHIPETVSKAENSKSLKSVESSPDHQMKETQLSEDTSVSEKSSINLATPQMSSFSEQCKKIQQTNVLLNENATKDPKKQYLHSFNVIVPNGVAIVTASLLDSISQNSYPTVQTSETHLEGRDWLLKSPAPLEIVCPKNNKKSSRLLRSSYKPHKGILATVRRYRARGITVRSPPPEVYLQEAAKELLEDMQHDEDEVEDEAENEVEDFQQDEASDTQNFLSIDFKNLVNGDICQEDETMPNNLFEENANSSKNCETSKEDLPTAYDIISEGFKKSKIHHQSLPNLDHLELKSHVNKATHKKQ